LLGQEPLAGRVPTAALLRLAGILDDAGFGLLEISGGGVFDSAVRRGVESPWERIRAIHARTKTPLGMALRGRFLVGSRPVGGAVYPVALTLHRVSGEGLAQALGGLGLDCTVDVDALWTASELVDGYVGDEPVTPLAPRVAVRAAEHALPAGVVAALDVHLRAHSASDRIDAVLEELERIREEVGSPPLAAPIGHILASPAPGNVL